MCRVGDVSDVVLAYWVYHLCKGVDGGLSSKDKNRMKRNIALDGVIGLVPFLGDVADTAFKANMRNLKILEQHLKDKYDPVDRDYYKKSGKPKRRGTKRYDYDRRSDSTLDEDELDDPPRRSTRRRDWDDEYDDYEYDRAPPRSSRRNSRRDRRY